MQTAMVDQQVIASSSTSIQGLDTEEQKVVSLLASIVRKRKSHALYRTLMKEAREIWAAGTYDSPQIARYALHAAIGKTNQIMAQAIKQSVRCTRFVGCRAEQLDVRTKYNRQNGFYIMTIRCSCCGLSDRLEEAPFAGR